MKILPKALLAALLLVSACSMAQQEPRDSLNPNPGPGPYDYQGKGAK